VAAVVGTVVVALSGCMGFRPAVRSMMTPRVAFAEEQPPPAPDYADDAAWSALPGRQDAGDAVPDGLTAVDQLQAPVDVFYVHPTSYVGKRWNGPTDDPKLNADTDRVATGIQATAFNGCCAVYAPRYRQANGTAFTDPRPDGELALDLAFQDVKRAFEAFQQRRGADRPFVLAAHSQGSVVAERLLYDVIAGTPVMERLVFAVLPGGSVTVEGLRERGVPACQGPDDTGCVVAWNARGPRYSPNEFSLVRPDTRERLCTNPLSWKTDGERVPAEKNQGAVFLESDDTAPRPGFADARCEAGTLVVSEIGKAPRDLPSRILDAALGPENYHPIEYQMYFVDLRESARHRVERFVAR
jgi:hypothetical protein